jgi:nicotinamide riboside transporter PnuC
MIEFLFYIGTFMAILGTFLNAYKHKNGFILWVVSNSILLYQSYCLSAYNLVILYLIYIIISIIGYYHWSKKRRD